MVKQRIKDNFNNKENLYKPILNIIDKRWTLHFEEWPLIGAEAFLNPRIYYSERENGSDLGDFYEASF
jgi:hypothetical protein